MTDNLDPRHGGVKAEEVDLVKAAWFDAWWGSLPSYYENQRAAAYAGFQFGCDSSAHEPHHLASQPPAPEPDEVEKAIAQIETLYPPLVRGRPEIIEAWQTIKRALQTQSRRQAVGTIMEPAAWIEYGFTACEKGWSLEKTLDTISSIASQPPAQEPDEVQRAIEWLDDLADAGAVLSVQHNDDMRTQMRNSWQTIKRVLQPQPRRQAVGTRVTVQMLKEAFPTLRYGEVGFEVAADRLNALLASAAPAEEEGGETKL